MDMNSVHSRIVQYKYWPTRAGVFLAIGVGLGGLLEVVREGMRSGDGHRCGRTEGLVVRARALVEIAACGGVRGGRLVVFAPGLVERLEVGGVRRRLLGTGFGWGRSGARGGGAICRACGCLGAVGARRCCVGGIGL